MIQKGKAFFHPGRDTKVKAIYDRINATEKQFGEMCFMFAAYCRKLGRYRDKNDDLAKFFGDYANEEAYNKSLAASMDNLSKALTFIADSFDLEVTRLETKILNVLTPYEARSRNTKDCLRVAVAKRDKELTRKKQLADLRNKFAADSRAADSEFLKVKLEVNRSNKEIDEIIESFEKQKLNDIKSVLIDFIQIQMKQLTKSIEILSAAYQDLSEIDEQKDFLSFRRSLKDKSRDPADHIYKFRSRSMDSLDAVDLRSPIKRRNDRMSKSIRDLTAEFSEEEKDEEISSAEENSASGDEYSDESKSDSQGNLSPNTTPLKQASAPCM